MISSFKTPARVPGPAQVVGYLHGTIGFAVAGAGATGTANIGVVPKGAMITRVIVRVTEAFNAATTNVLVVGDAGAADRYVAAADVTEGTIGGYYGTTATGIGYEVTQDTTIVAQYSETGVAATAGAADVIVEFITPTDLGD